MLHEETQWISNVVITEKKKEPGNIRMNIDMREPNKAIQRTPRHVTSTRDAPLVSGSGDVFRVIDMNHGFHQIALAPESRPISTFHTHEGLHRFKVLFFGVSPASDQLQNSAEFGNIYVTPDNSDGARAERLTKSYKRR